PRGAPIAAIGQPAEDGAGAPEGRGDDARRHPESTATASDQSTAGTSLMAIFVKYNSFIDDLAGGGQNLKTAVYKCALTNTAPNAATDTTMTAPPPAAINGYPNGGNTLTTTSATTTGGLFRLKLADTVFTAAGGAIGPFRYVI